MIIERSRMLATLALCSFAAHCALVFDPDALGPRTTLADAGDEPTVGDGSRGLEADSVAPPADGGGDGRGPTGLDDRVALPALDGAACMLSTGGFDPACGTTKACRMATADSGRCEDCTNRCAGGLGQACDKSYDCDSLFECFRGRCSGRCTLGEHECGAVESCLDVGYLGGIGLCDPSTL